MTWTGQSFSVGQILTAAQMNNVQGDITAVPNGDSGAPNVQTAGLADGAVTQVKLSTAIQTSTTTSTTGANITFSSGQYGWWPQIKIGNATATARIGPDAAASSGTTFETLIQLSTTDAAQTAEVRQRYTQASPPYDLGDGEVFLFVFCVIDNATGDVETTSIAPEAPWHYNGPTRISADVVDAQGRRMQRIKIVPAEIEAMPANLRAAAMLDIAPELVEVTQAIKNADMNLLPHPFTHNDLTGKTVVMLDPVSTLIREMFELHTHDESVADLLHAGDIIISNTPLARSGPAGLLIPSVRWR